jgi:hypothetical protein
MKLKSNFEFSSLCLGVAATDIISGAWRSENGEWSCQSKERFLSLLQIRIRSDRHHFAGSRIQGLPIRILPISTESKAKHSK